MDSKINILIVDDQPLARLGIRTLLQGDSSLNIVGESQDGLQAVVDFRKYKPDVVVMNLNMPTINGDEAARRMLYEDATLKIVILSEQAIPECVMRLVRLKVSGYVLKSDSLQDLLLSIQESLKGRLFFSQKISQIILDERVNGGSGKKITGREMQVLKLVADGYPNKAIANLLSISAKTVDNHRQSIMGKLNIHHVAGLTRYAIEQKIV